jgi:hypothetical protein
MIADKLLAAMPRRPLEMVMTIRYLPGALSSDGLKHRCVNPIAGP